MSRSVFLLAVFATLSIPAAALAQGVLVPTEGAPNRAFVLEHQHVDVVVDQGIATYKVQQEFRNLTATPIEATYYMPLPEGSTLSSFAMWMNGRKTQASLLSKRKALEVYEAIVAKLVDPGLIEYVDQDLVQARIFPIMPGETQKVELQFASLVEVEGDRGQLRYPLRAGAATGGVSGEASLTVTIADELPVASAYSPSHPVSVHKSDGQTVVEYREAGAKLEQDFQLYFAYTEEPVGMSVVSYRLAGEDGYFLLMAAPGDPPDVGAQAKDITFVIDTSGSMTGGKMEGVRDALSYCLESLNPADRFTVVRFAEQAETLSPTPVEATPAHVEAGLAFVNGLEPLGGTNIYEAVDAALSYRAPADRPHYVVMLTDGTPTVGVTSNEAIAELARSRTEGTDGQVRIFAFGLGYDVSTGLLDTLAAENRGTADYLQPGEDVEWVISSFFRRISRPVLTQVDLDLGNAQVFDVYPGELPDLYSGTQLLVLGRYSGRGDQTIQLTGVANGQPCEFRSRVNFAGQPRDEADFLPRMWASRKVGFLLDEIRRDGETSERVDEVKRLGYRYGILTPYTSFLATEDMPVADLIAAEDPSDALKVLWSAAPASAAADGMDRAFADAFRGFDDDTGADAVQASLAIDALQSASLRSLDAPGQVVGDRVFHFRGGVWIDESFDVEMDTLSVRSMSDGYFALLRDHPELRRYAALGESVVMVVGDDRAVFFTPGGKDLRPGKLSAFVGR